MFYYYSLPSPPSKVTINPISKQKNAVVGNIDKCSNAIIIGLHTNNHQFYHRPIPDPKSKNSIQFIQSHKNKTNKKLIHREHNQSTR